MGRPTKFNDVNADLMLFLYEQEKYTDAQVAEVIGVDVSTIDKWKVKHPDFFQSLKVKKRSADRVIVNKLYERAHGFWIMEEKVFVAFGVVTRVKVPKYFPPDPTSMIFWLKNRDRTRWRDVSVIESEQNSKEYIKKSFSDFCIAAGYPAPYPKQIEMMEFGIANDVPRLILGARGYGKSDYVTIMGVAYDVYLNGLEAKNLIISKSKPRNSAIIEEIASALIANGVKLEKKNTSCLRVNGLIGKEHSVEVLTIKSSFRGRHPHRLLMDDPVTEEDTSEAMRLLVKKKYDEAYKLCKNIVIIGQPAHKFDLYAELRPKLKKLEIPYGQIPELDADLEAMRMAGIDQNSIEMSYHLRVPVDGSTPFDKIRYLDSFTPGDCVAWIDPSFKGTDYTALTIMKGHFEGVAVLGFCYKKAWNHCIDEMIQKIQDNGVRKVAIECNSLGTQPVEMLQGKLRGVGIIGKETTTNKHSRIMAAGAFAHLIHLAKNSDQVYIDQVVKYEYHAKNDDAPDSLASCLEWIGLIRGK